ncbi:MAG TPA: ABC transporter permease [Miltoncostaeaceae bacterium]|jgi:ABC-2 type transport system permease protein|nr:ABC transporter permease [Miltoncostaeaceae bacterium]
MTTTAVPAARWRGVAALAEREVLRVLRLWTQTIAPPVVSAVLFIVVFGVALGSSIRVIDGVPYERFIVPGLVLMSVATSAFGNNATSIYQARNDGFIEDPASSPMGPGQLLAGYLSGGVVRGLVIGGLTLAAARVFVDYPVDDPLVLAAALAGASVAFAALGTVVGLHSTGWEQQNVVGNLVIAPLAFLGGVFYSIDALAEPWRSLTHADPIFYMVVAARHGTLGGSEVPLGLSLGITLGLAAAMLAWAWWTFVRGVGIRT